MNTGYQKYKPFQPISFPERTWPEKVIDRAPTWCSVDLRDGNQALVTPMNLHRKIVFFKMLTEIGFKEIEIGFPSASETEFETIRYLIEEHLIPDDVTVQVLVQARAHLIDKTFEAIRGAKNVIVHFPVSSNATNLVSCIRFLSITVCGFVATVSKKAPFVPSGVIARDNIFPLF